MHCQGTEIAVAQFRTIHPRDSYLKDVRSRRVRFNGLFDDLVQLRTRRK